MKKKIIILSVLVLTFTLCLFTTNKLKDTSASEVEQVSNDYSNITSYQGTAIDWNGYLDTIYFNNLYNSLELYNLLSSLPYFSLPQVPDKSIYPIWSNSDMTSTIVINFVHEPWDDGTYWNSYHFMVLDASFNPLYYFGNLKYIGSSTPYVICNYASDDLSSYTINSQNYVGSLLNYLGVSLPNRNEDLSCLFSSTPFQLKGASGGASEEELQNAYNNGLDDGYEFGLEDGYDNGYDVGYNDGTAESQVQLDYLQNEVHKLETQNSQLEKEKIEEYNKGYNDSAEDNQSFKDMVFSIIEAPFKVIKEALNFEIFGINISGLVLFLITGALIIFILKLFL